MMTQNEERERQLLKEVKILEKSLGYFDSNQTINVELSTLLDILPRNRRRADAYYSIQRMLSDRFGVTLNILTNDRAIKVDELKNLGVVRLDYDKNKTIILKNKQLPFPTLDIVDDREIGSIEKINETHPEIKIKELEKPTEVETLEFPSRPDGSLDTIKSAIVVSAVTTIAAVGLVALGFVLNKLITKKQKENADQERN